MDGHLDLFLFLQNFVFVCSSISDQRDASSTVGTSTFQYPCSFIGTVDKFGQIRDRVQTEGLWVESIQVQEGAQSTTAHSILDVLNGGVGGRLVSEARDVGDVVHEMLTRHHLEEVHLS